MRAFLFIVVTLLLISFKPPEEFDSIKVICPDEVRYFESNFKITHEQILLTYNNEGFNYSRIFIVRDIKEKEGVTIYSCDKSVFKVHRGLNGRIYQVDMITNKGEVHFTNELQS